jgi:hypothetical protein
MRACDFAARTALALGAASIVVGSVGLAQDAKREPIGEVLGKIVYRDQLRGAASEALADQLHHLFSSPLYDA